MNVLRRYSWVLLVAGVTLALNLSWAIHRLKPRPESASPMVPPTVSLNLQRPAVSIDQIDALPLFQLERLPAAAAPAAGSNSSETEAPLLRGIAGSAGELTALLETRSSGVSKLLRVGQRLGDWVLVDVHARQAKLRADNGRTVELNLRQEPQRPEPASSPSP